MSDPLTLARTARESLAAALNALQSPDAPEPLLEIAEPIAEAMGVLHKIERSGGAVLERRDVALAAVRRALNLLQQQDLDHPAVMAAMEAVATSLSKVHTLSKLPAPAARAAPPAAGPRSTDPIVNPQPRAYGPPSADTASTLPRGASPPEPAYPPSAVQHPAAPGPPGYAAGHPAAAGAPQGYPAAYPAAAPPAAYGGQVYAPPAYPPPGPAYPPPAQPAPAAHHPGAYPAAPSAHAFPPQAHPAAPQASQGAYGPPAAASGGPRLPSAVSVAPLPPGEGVDVELGTHSASNFYKGLGGNDVIEHGGIFVATYRSPRIGTAVVLRVTLPGDYEFRAAAVVQWIREASDAAPPGFGARFTQISPEGRQLVYRYTRNREPMFYDDL